MAERTGPSEERERSYDTSGSPVYDKSVRQGQVVLDTRLRRILFFGGLIALVLVAAVLVWW
ncbi:MAG: peptide ABC transporter permease [Rhodospirillaceae bacterium]|nr:peptide ABC transporter permease [Rhodospirillaceae bacterium]